MPEINLLENRMRDTTHARQTQLKLALSLLAVVLIVLIAAGVFLFILNKSNLDKIDSVAAENKTLQKKLDDKQESLSAAKSFQAQLANLKMLLKSHIYLTPVLDELSKSTYVRAQYIGLEVTKEGHIHLEGRIDTYKELGKLMLGLSTSTQFKDVKLLSVSPSGGATNNYKFAIDMSVPPNSFYQK